jgi:hypothetical protein
MTKFAMLSNTFECGVKLFIAETETHSEAVKIIYAKWCTLHGYDVSNHRVLNGNNVKELDEMDFSHISKDTQQEIILCN